MSEQEIDSEIGRRLRVRRQRLERFSVVNSRLADIAQKLGETSGALRLQATSGYESEPDSDIGSGLDVGADSVRALLSERETLRMQLGQDQEFLRTHGL